MQQESITKDSTELAVFSKDLEFLKEHTSVIHLTDPDKMSGIIVCPELQGRVITSTAEGDQGPSFGWINYDLIASGKLLPAINPFGGEDRFWLGPEGGQFAVFFEKDEPFDLDHAKTPDPIDKQAFDVESKGRDRVYLSKKMNIRNYSGTEFDLKVDRVVRLLPYDAAIKWLGLHPFTKVKMVAFQSENTLTNTGDKAWEKASGLLSIWILGMFKASASTTVVIPINESEDPLQTVNDRYFGEIPEDRLTIKNNILFFKGDAQFRSKVGVSLKGTKPILGSYDAEHEVLTLVQFTMLEEAKDYVNSMWEIQINPFNGDVVNSYNDGPAADGKQLGNFYELETSSCAAELRPGENLFHLHRTFHIYGERETLNDIALHTLGVTLDVIETALP